MAAEEVEEVVVVEVVEVVEPELLREVQGISVSVSDSREMSRVWLVGGESENAM